MEKDLPDLYSNHSNGDSKDKRKPLIMGVVDAINDGGSIKSGNTEFSLNRKRAAILTDIGDTMVEMAVDRHLDARLKARVPVMGGDVEVEANRDADGKRRFGFKSRHKAFGGNLDVDADRDADGNNRVGIRFSKQFSSSKP